ncbi:hypothetical protein B0T10DRAFT_562287 [Thelonectria olida]|uniref:DUF7730 domain-containing protein n=1 Tax=Thelonectria olida TaxID=1576542 RepID=A0A9P8W630_9HYPO|nr:hypothetical protein B0T10DRAFT_562287 [Thelonectria olida]
MSSPQEIVELSANSRMPPEAYQQQQSMFFTKLDAWTRDHIYHWLFGSKYLHIKHPAPVHSHQTYCACQRGNRGDYCHEGCREGQRLTAVQFLRTCRRVHDEATGILYESNTMAFENHNALYRIYLTVGEK